MTDLKYAHGIGAGLSIGTSLAHFFGDLASIVIILVGLAAIAVYHLDDYLDDYLSDFAEGSR